MKTLKTILNGLFISICLLAVAACSGSSNEESKLTPEERAEIDRLEEALLNESNSKAEAVSAAQGFIRQEFASNAEFEDEGTIVEETSVPGRYKILQKFTAEDHPSNWIHFIYRIWVQRFDDGSWEFGNLAVESITGENVLTKNGDMKKREQMDGVGDKLTAGGIEFFIAEKKPTAIRLYTKSKLSKSKLRGAIKDLMDKYETIHFSTEEKHERGDEYACWTSGIYCDYRTNEVIGKDKFFN